MRLNNEFQVKNTPKHAFYRHKCHNHPPSLHSRWQHSWSGLSKKIEIPNHERPITAELVDSILSRKFDDLEPTLTRHGYRLKDMVEQFDAKPGRCSVTSETRRVQPNCGIVFWQRVYLFKPLFSASGVSCYGGCSSVFSFSANVG